MDENATIVLGGNIVEPINCKAIILGDKRQKFNPATEEYYDTGDGVYLWRIDQPRHSSHFLLAYENSRYKRE